MSQTTAPNGVSGGHQPHVFILDYMRTRSNLFWRWMSTHPSFYASYHPYLMPGFLGPERITQWTKNSEKRKADLEGLMKVTPVDEMLVDGTRELRRQIDTAENQGKRLLTNEHGICFMKHELQLDLIRIGDKALPSDDSTIPNPLEAPTDVFENLTPLLLIRHPILQVDSIIRSMTANSNCRPGDEDFSLITCARHSRYLFEYFKQIRDGKTPIVVDGEDVLWRVEELGRNLTQALDLEPGGFKDHWDPMPEESKSKNWFVAVMTANMFDSTGIQRPNKKPDLDLEQFFKDWTDKFGLDVAQQLRAIVEEGMPHYEYLAQFKL